MFNFPFHQRELGRYMWSARFWRGERQLECADTNMSTRVYTGTCTGQDHNFFFLFNGGGGS